MNKELLIDLLVYLDTQLNWKDDIFLGNDITKSVQIIANLQDKHKDFSDAKKRQKLIIQIIGELNDE